MEEHRSFVKHSYIRASKSGAGRAKAHVNYVAFRPGKDKDKDSKPREFFSSDQDKVAGEAVKEAIDKQPKYGVLAHKFILSPGVEGADVQQYTKAVMQDLSRRKGVELEWYGIVHENTANPHCHVIVMGRKMALVGGIGDFFHSRANDFPPLPAALLILLTLEIVAFTPAIIEVKSCLR